MNDLFDLLLVLVILFIIVVVFQNTPFGTVFYDIIGDDSSPVYFSINSATGDVTIAASLTQENVDEYRVSTGFILLSL